MTSEYFEKLYKAAEEKAAELGVTQFELYYSGSEDLSAETFRDELASFSAGQSGSLIVRLTKNGKAGSATGTVATPEEAALLMEKAFENAALIEKEEEVLFCKGGQSYRPLPESSFVMPSAIKVKESAMAMRQAAYASSPEISDGTAGGAYAGKSEIYLYTSQGLRLSIENGQCGGYIYSVVERDGEKKDGFKLENKPFEEIDSTKVAEQAFQKASERFGATLPESGSYPVVFDGKQMQQILATFVSAFYAKEAQLGTSPLKDKEGKQVAVPALTLIDDPFYPGNSMQINFDGEGTPTYTKDVIKNGVLETLLYNLETGKKAGKPSTGNGARGTANIGTKFYNLYIKPGDKSREDLFRMAEGGIYVTEMKGFHGGANPVTGDFSIESEGFLIENGKKGRPVKSFTVSGNFFELLKQIGEIGNEIEDQTPGYSKIRCPDVYLPSLSIAGK